MHNNSRAVVEEKDISRTIRFMGLTPATANVRPMEPVEVGSKRPQPDSAGPELGIDISNDFEGSYLASHNTAWNQSRLPAMQVPASQLQAKCLVFIAIPIHS